VTPEWSYGFDISWGSQVDWTNGLGGSCSWYFNDSGPESYSGSYQIPPGDWTMLSRNDSA